MFQLSNSPIPGWAYNSPALGVACVFAIATLMVIILAFATRVRRRGFCLLGALVYTVALVLISVAYIPTGNVDSDKVFEAIEDQTSLHAVERTATNVSLWSVVNGAPITRDTPELVGYTGGTEVRFKVSLDDETGDITDLVIVRPAESITVDDLLGPAANKNSSSERTN